MINFPLPLTSKDFAPTSAPHLWQASIPASVGDGHPCMHSVKPVPYRLRFLDLWTASMASIP